MIIDSSPQGTPEWLAARTGVLTASGFSKIITPTGKETSGKVRDDYLLETANGTLTGKPAEETFCNSWMQRGTELEPEARSFYEFISGNTVAQAGLIYLDESRRVGASVDGLVNDDGHWEAKCPKLTTHLRYLVKGELPTAYVPQVQGQMYVTGREYCDFLSYHPGAYQKGLIVRVNRDEIYIEKLATALSNALEQVDELAEAFKEQAA